MLYMCTQLPTSTPTPTFSHLWTHQRQIHVAVIYSKTLFADTEPHDNPSKYVMRPDPQPGAWPRPADVSSAGKYFPFPPPSLSCTHSFTRWSNIDHSSFHPIAVWVCLSHSLEAAACLNTHFLPVRFTSAERAVCARIIFLPLSWSVQSTCTCTLYEHTPLAFQAVSPHCLHVEHELPPLCCLQASDIRETATIYMQSSFTRKLHKQVSYVIKYKTADFFMPMIMERIYVYHSTECLSA